MLVSGFGRYANKAGKETGQPLKVERIAEDEEFISAEVDSISPHFIRQPWICKGVKRTSVARKL